MKAKLTQYIPLSAAIGGWLIAIAASFGGCSTAEVAPKGPLPALPPPYVTVPHPVGYTISDLRAIFTTQGAPELEDLKDCDADFKKLRSLTVITQEHLQGARELVRRDPVKYHWCYYGKILKLEETLKKENYLDEKQKAVLDTYGSVTPIGRAFMQEFHDSRYLRWGVRHYRGISEWVFYRKLEMTPQATSELVEASNPFGLLRETSASVPILEKYGLMRSEPVPLPPPAATAASVPPTMPATTPAAPAASATTPVSTDTASVTTTPQAPSASPVPAPEPVASIATEYTGTPATAAQPYTSTATPGESMTTDPTRAPASMIETQPVEPAPVAPAAPEPAAYTPVAEPAPAQQTAAAEPEPEPFEEESTDGSVEAILQGDNVVPTDGG